MTIFYTSVSNKKLNLQNTPSLDEPLSRRNFRIKLLKRFRFHAMSKNYKSSCFTHGNSDIAYKLNFSEKSICSNTIKDTNSVDKLYASPEETIPQRRLGAQYRNQDTSTQPETRRTISHVTYNNSLLSAKHSRYLTQSRGTQNMYNRKLEKLTQLTRGLRL